MKNDSIFSDSISIWKNFQSNWLFYKIYMISRLCASWCIFEEVLYCKSQSFFMYLLVWSRAQWEHPQDKNSARILGIQIADPKFLAIIVTLVNNKQQACMIQWKPSFFMFYIFKASLFNILIISHQHVKVVYWKCLDSNLNQDMALTSKWTLK